MHLAYLSIGRNYALCVFIMDIICVLSAHLNLKFSKLVFITCSNVGL